MGNNYKNVSYFESRPDVVKIFDDLENYLDFCRFELLRFDPSDLYNNRSPVWRQYSESQRPRKSRGEYSRSNYNRKARQ